MNRGHVLQSSPVQQMMTGNPNWWNINNMRPPPQPVSHLLPSAPSSSSSSSSSSSPSPSSMFPPYLPPNSISINCWQDTQDLPESWSQLLMGGLVSEEDRCSFNQFQPRKMENWADQVLYSSSASMVDVKQESSEGGYLRGHESDESQGLRSPWGQVLPACSPRSCVTSLSSNMLDFSNSKTDQGRHQQSDHTLECNSTPNGSAYKKARVQPSPSQSTSKVRKEKLGDRITALHQLVSPFGKTDTASVLLEAIGYIRFLQNQIEALSSPYLGSASSSGTMRQPAQGERACVFPEDPGQLFDDACIKRRGSPEKVAEGEPKKDLRSRGLCLVPVACTLQVGSDNGADYWAPALGGGFR